MDRTWVWIYDDAGNILSRTEYAYTTGELGEPVDTVLYGYNDGSWGDLLTSYDGQTITHDNIGNPLFDGTWTYTWEQGRQLASMTDGTTTWEYTYDANGMRTSRTNGSDSYTYVYNGSQLVQMTRGSDTLYFTYGANGPLSVTWNGTTYYYVLDAFGTIEGLISASGTVAASYVYDAWGNIILYAGSMASTLGILNPLVYRNYVYDHETDLYYLQSRYYDPELGRFINADALVSTGQGILGNNMFAYCCNNPVSRKDASGTEGVCVENFNEDDNPLNDLGNPTGRGGGSGSTWQAFRSTLHHAANGLKMASGQRDQTHVENHHLISNKTPIKDIECKEIVNRYNYSLDHYSNQVPLKGHRGRHTDAYHGFVAVAIKELDIIAGGSTDVFIEGMKVLGEFVKENWWLPYSQYK